MRRSPILDKENSDIRILFDRGYRAVSLLGTDKPDMIDLLEAIDVSPVQLEADHLRTIKSLIQQSMFWRPGYLAQSSWLEHVPFAFWLVETHRPQVLVELGSHYGVSYFSFCQAIERLNWIRDASPSILGRAMSTPASIPKLYSAPSTDITTSSIQGFRVWFGQPSMKRRSILRPLQSTSSTLMGFTR